MKIVCPHCNQSFDMDENVADHIRQQIRSQEFEKDLADKTEIARQLAASEYKEKLLLKDAEAAEELRKADEQHRKEVAKLSDEITKLETEAKVMQANHESNVKQAILDTKDSLANKIADMESELKAKECELAYYKDLKAKMSTKMVGETLEQHCEIEFNKIRMAAFPRAEFGKDNEISKDSGSKGDYIFREYDENGVEIISIMFEMKNEMDSTEKKHKNSDFFKELDKDRKEKKCEYAVLVTMLEANNDLYNQGIVDVSYQYDKMYVIRPQFFITLISLLRNAALTSMKYKYEMIAIQNQNMDIIKFDEQLQLFKTGFARNYDLASRQFQEAIDGIDKTINYLQKVKDSLTKSENNLRLANEKATNITVEKLTKNSPSLRNQIDNIK